MRANKFGRPLFSFSHREKGGPAAQRWGDEGLGTVQGLAVLALKPRKPSPSHARGAGPSLSLWERASERGLNDWTPRKGGGALS